MSDEDGKLKSAALELVLPSKRNIVNRCVCKQTNDEFLTPLLSKLVKEEKLWLLIGIWLLI